MTTTPKIPSSISLSNIVITLGFVIALLYFSYHAINNQRGLSALVKLTEQHQIHQQELDHIRIQRLKLEHRIKLLQHDSLDLDLLDQQTRKILGYAEEDELVYTIKPEVENQTP